MKTLLLHLAAGVFLLIGSSVRAQDPIGLGTCECRAFQLYVQRRVTGEGPYKNHGQLVQNAIRLITEAKKVPAMTNECAQFIITQFAQRDSIAQQDPGGPDPNCGLECCPVGWLCESCYLSVMCLRPDEGCIQGLSPRDPIAAGTTSDAGRSDGQDALAIGPNPLGASSEWVLSFSLPSSDAARVEILDITGRSVLSEDIGRGPSQRSVRLKAPTELRSGIYLVRLVQGGKVWTRTAFVIR